MEWYSHPRGGGGGGGRCWGECLILYYSHPRDGGFILCAIIFSLQIKRWKFDAIVHLPLYVKGQRLHIIILSPPGVVNSWWGWLFHDYFSDRGVVILRGEDYILQVGWYLHPPRFSLPGGDIIYHYLSVKSINNITTLEWKYGCKIFTPAMKFAPLRVKILQHEIPVHWGKYIVGIEFSPPWLG